MQLQQMICATHQFSVSVCFDKYLLFSRYLCVGFTRFAVTVGQVLDLLVPHERCRLEDLLIVFAMVEFMWEN